MPCHVMSCYVMLSSGERHLLVFLLIVQPEHPILPRLTHQLPRHMLCPAAAAAFGTRCWHSRCSCVCCCHMLLQHHKASMLHLKHFAVRLSQHHSHAHTLQHTTQGSGSARSSPAAAEGARRYVCSCTDLVHAACWSTHYIQSCASCQAPGEILLTSLHCCPSSSALPAPVLASLHGDCCCSEQRAENACKQRYVPVSAVSLATT